MNLINLIVIIFLMLLNSNNATSGEFYPSFEPYNFYKCNIERFNGFSTPVYHGPVAKKIKYDHVPQAKKFRAALQNALEDGINFAGHYSAAVWGCGSNCIGLGIVDAISGEVVFYSGESLTYNKLNAHDEKYDVPLGVLFVPDSKLLLVNPTCTTDRAVLEEMRHLAFGDGSPRYYIWNSRLFDRVELNQ